MADALAGCTPAGSAPSIAFAGCWREAWLEGLSSPLDLLVFDPYAGGRFETEPVAAFAEQFGSCGLVAYARFPRGCAGQVLELSRSGVHAVVTGDVDDRPAEFGAVVRAALERSALAQGRAIWEARTPASVRGLFLRLLQAPQEGLTPAAAGRMWHAHPKTIRTHLRRAGLPPLGKLIVWARLVRACQFLQDAGRSIENVALVLGFASANSFRNQLLRYTGLRPSEVRRPGGMRSVLLRFEGALQPGASAAGGSARCGRAPSRCVPGPGEDATVRETALHGRR
ncbi:MAG TPA: AraC family transcriptional regulator [Longimicrobiaceae bacterium]|nr:AraC family transcriptional regulator [Longimicrobiaceae bacterium]